MKKIGRGKHKILKEIALAIFSLLLCSFTNSETIIELNKKHSGENQVITFSNLFPGDVIQSTYRVRIHHSKDEILLFSLISHDVENDLSKYFSLKITGDDPQDNLYEGTIYDFKDKIVKIPLQANTNQTSEVVFNLNIELDTSVGNEAQEGDAQFDLYWELEDNQEIPSTKPPNQEIFKPPFTLDMSSTEVKWWVGLFLILVILLITRLRFGKKNAK